MNKIEEIRNQLAITADVFTNTGEHTGLSGAFYAGFNAAMDLQLPVKFMTWIRKAGYQWSLNGKWYSNDTNLDTFGDYKSEEELYTYWLSNIYAP